MKIGILSDTHDESLRVEQAVRRLKALGAQALFHCGDITDIYSVQSCAGIAAYFVFGNNDHERDQLCREMLKIGARCLDDGGEVTVGGKRIAITHGDDRRLMARLIAAGPDYLFHGHSHQEIDRREGRTRIINPGALFRAPEWTYALLDLQTDRLERLVIPKEAA